MHKIKTTQTTEGLPLFPEFVFLGAHHQAYINEKIKANFLYSDFNFLSLWSWDHQNRLQLCELNDNLVIKFQDYLNPEEYFYTFFGTSKVVHTAKTLLEQSVKEGKSELRLIPEFVAELLRGSDSFVVTEDRDNHDYIIALNTMVELKGSHNNNKRNALRQFMRDNGDQLSVSELDLNKEEDRKKIRGVVERWGSQVESKDSFNENELKAIDKILNNQQKIATDHIHVIGINLGGELKAFSIAEILQSEFAMWHYKKSDRTVKGLGAALDQLSAKFLAGHGVKNLNHEQDLGVEGLRKAKMAADPVYFMKKYNVALAKK